MSDHQPVTAPNPALVVSWLAANPEVIDQARQPAKATGKAPVDAYLSDPELLVNAVRYLAAQAVERDAPEGVAEGLLRLLRPMVATLRQRDLYQYSFSCVAQLEGLRDAVEFAPIIRAAAEGSPDARNRAVLEGLLTEEHREVLPEYVRVICAICGASDIIVGIDEHGCDICESIFNLLHPVPWWEEPDPLVAGSSG